MIRGAVNERLEAVIPLTVFGSLGTNITLEAVLDTGFDDFLSLPLEIIAQLALPAHNVMPVMLSDGSVVQAMYFEAEVDWENTRKPVLVQAAPNVPLVGMALLEESRLTIDIEIDGIVQIERK